MSKKTYFRVQNKKVLNTSAEWYTGWSHLLHWINERDVQTKWGCKSFWMFDKRKFLKR